MMIYEWISPLINLLKGNDYYIHNTNYQRIFCIALYSRSQNNVNIVYCNYNETNSSYNVIAKRSSPQTLLIVGNIFKIFVWNFEEAYAI